MRCSLILTMAVSVFSSVALGEPSSDDTMLKMAEAIRKQCPEATVEVTKDGFIGKQGTTIYTMHSISKTGEVGERTYQQEGPNFKGFWLRVTLHEGKYAGAAKVPQTLQGPYYPTFIDAVPTEGGRKHYQIAFSYGSQTDPKIKQPIFDILQAHVASRQDQPATNAAAEPAKLKTGAVPVGSLGHPLGTYLTLEGQRVDGLKTGVQTLRIGKINGVALAQPLSIWVDNVDLPADKVCILKGYESARMVGAPEAYVQAMKEMGKEALMPQAGWQVKCFFVALRVLAPKDLQVKE